MAATLATIRGLARIFADQTNSTFPTDAECNTLIDTAGHRVWRKLIRAGWRPARDFQSITATGAFDYLIATNISYIEQVVRVDGTVVTPLTRIKPEQRATMESMGTGPATHYILWSGVVTADGDDEMQISLFPRPTSGTYRVDIQEQFSGFGGDDDFNWFGPESSDELVALWAAVQMLYKEGDTEMAGVRTKQYEDLYAQVCEEAGWLDATQQPTVRDVRCTANKDPYDYQAGEGWF